MFRDARAMDRQRTAASFDQALSRYHKTAESWFDGAVGSVDSRLAHCDRLLHSAKFTVARVDISDAQRYLAAANSLADDRRALEALRSDLLTGASDYQETHVAGIPVSATTDLVDTSKMWNNFGELGVSQSLPPTPSHPAAPAATPAGNGHPWLSDLGHHGSHRSAKPQPPMMQNAIQPATVKPEVGGFDINTKLPKVKKPKPVPPLGGQPPAAPPVPKISGADRRWVTLESAKFVAANTNALDDLHELATRAHHHAQVATSTFTPARSAAICRSFVAATVELGKKNAPKRSVRRQAASLDFDPQMLFLS